MISLSFMFFILFISTYLLFFDTFISVFSDELYILLFDIMFCNGIFLRAVCLIYIVPTLLLPFDMEGSFNRWEFL